MAIFTPPPKGVVWSYVEIFKCKPPSSDTYRVGPISLNQFKYFNKRRIAQTRGLCKHLLRKIMAVESLEFIIFVHNEKPKFFI
jgi:hypothetical protein